MKIEELKYSLNASQVVTEPREIRLGRRDLGRMMVVDRKKAKQIDSYVLKFPEYFNPGDILVLNNSKRIPGILKGNIISNKAQVELFFVNLGKNDSAMCRIYPSHHIRIGTLIKVGSDIVEVTKDNLTKYNLFEVHATTSSLRDTLKNNGIALNTVYSSKQWSVTHLNPCYSTIEGSVESPLAGLHFTPELLKNLEEKGVRIGYVTLHSSGSWLPFVAEDIDNHDIQEEEYEMPTETAIMINEAKLNGNKVIACGSTAMRTIETTSENGKVKAQKGYSKLYIKPGYKFKIVDGYFTNFHQYRTSLMVLDAAFCGKDLLMKSYEKAKKKNYFFYEYGDAIFYL